MLNFIDMLSHARTESLMVRELASNEAAYRSITQSWLRHSAVSGLFRSLAAQDCTVVLTTDHGSIRCYNPIKVIGDRNTNTNLRYKLGKNLSYNPKEVFEIKSPTRAGLPSPNLSTAYIFATQDDFFAYPNNYNYYVQYYKDTFQHGGISMEEMLIPLITLREHPPCLSGAKPPGPQGRRYAAQHQRTCPHRRVLLRLGRHGNHDECSQQSPTALSPKRRA